MRFESNAVEIITRGARAATMDALAETEADAKRRAKRVTGKWADSIQVRDVEEADGRITASLGSNLVSARAHERGAYIQAREGGLLTFDAGDGVRRVGAVRIPAQPAVEPAARRWADNLERRLAERLR